MLSSSHPKIHEPRAVGVSPRPTDRRQHQNCETRVTLWVPEILRTSCDVLILVEQAAEPIVSTDARRLGG
jgi:hypothetical protein